MTKAIFYSVFMCAFVLCGWYFWHTVWADKNNQEFMIKSKDFIDHGTLDQVNTCDGQDLSPHIIWAGFPESTKSFALICFDPDAPSGTWVHWVIYNIPANVNELSQGVGVAEHVLGNGVLQGINSWGRFGYGGACPPKGHGTHRYYFYIYALDNMLDIKNDFVDKDLLEGAMQGHILATAKIMGIYARD